MKLTVNQKRTTEVVGLERHHFELKSVKIPVIGADYYTTLGRKLFEIYQKHQISSEEQRELESLCFLLQSFVADREQNSRRGWFKFFARRRG